MKSSEAYYEFLKQKHCKLNVDIVKKLEELDGFGIFRGAPSFERDKDDDFREY